MTSAAAAAAVALIVTCGQGTRYTEGLLLGSVSRRQGTETEDSHEQRATSHREAGEHHICCRTAVSYGGTL